MVDPVIDEHFRRSLGADYMNLFAKRLDHSKSTSSITLSSPTALSPRLAAPQLRKSLQSPTIPSPIRPNQNPKKPSESLAPLVIRLDNLPSSEPAVDVEMSVDDHFAKALGETWKQLQQGNKQSTSTSPAELQHGTDSNDFQSAEEESDSEQVTSSSPVIAEMKKKNLTE